MLAWPKIQDRTLELAGGRLHYVEAGRGDPVILLHGGHGSWTHWVANIDALATSRRVLALDQPGFGASFTPQPEYTLEQYAQTVSGLMDALQLERAALVGFSFGCVVATATAAREPARVSHLVITNAPGTGARNPEVAGIQQRLSQIARSQSLKAAAIGSLRELQLYNHELIDDGVIDLMMKNVRGTRRITKDISRTSGTLALLQQVRQPVLVLLGEHDHHQLYRLDERRANILAAAPQARIELVERSRHWLAFDRADAFNALVSEFIGQ